MLKKNKAALVTGATNGIGLELTKKLLANGWNVFGTGRDIESLQKTKSEFSKFIPICADFTKNNDIERVAEIVKNTEEPLHLSVQNAGMKSPPRPLMDYDIVSIDEVFQVNLLAPMKLIALLTAQMPKESRILFVTSRAATLRLMEGSTYCASKAGINEMAGILRQELDKKNIGVACVIPGEVDTKIQRILRETTTFHLHKMFVDAYQRNQLIHPGTCAQFLEWLLCDLPFEDFKNSDIPISIYDNWHQSFWLKDQTHLPSFPF